MSPRTKEQLAQIKTRRRNQIMVVALENFAKSGYHKTSIDLIAKQANISKGLVYNYFQSKDDILKALIEMVFKEFEGLMSELNIDQPKEVLRKLFSLYFSLLRQKTEFYKLFAMISMRANEFNFIAEFVKQKYEQYKDLLTQLLSAIDLENPAEEALILTSLFDGIGFQYIVIGDDYPLDKYEKYIIDKYCK
ncbi:MAG: TetR/AcrR family transcriptional regulator [Candidatus Cyclobacteriaceae bacterium M3_2C_046]